jgi:Cu2+-exporting ATPase
MNDTCYHCGLEVRPNNKVNAEIKGVAHGFCCTGCALIAQTIFKSGAGGFYTRKTGASLPKCKLEYPTEFYDSDAFQMAFVNQSDDLKSVVLISEAIHCAACVWLIEKTLSNMVGVALVRVNLTNKHIKINWNNAVKLSEIMQKLADFGYSATPYEQNIAEQIANQQNKSLLYRISFSAFTMMNLLWISIALYMGANAGVYDVYFQWLSFALATPTLFYAGFPFLKNAYFGIKNRFLNMDVPISIGALATYFYSLYVLLGFSEQTEVYFDTVVNFIFVILIGRYVESASKKSALSASSALQQLNPKVAVVKTQNGEKITPVDWVKIKDIIIIKPGERIALDGVVHFGHSEVNESLLSGEPLPVLKKKGMQVYAGTLNINGALEVLVGKIARESTLAQIQDLVENTLASKSKIVCTIDKFIPYFVWTTLFLALVTFLFWRANGFDFALLSAVSVLIITCPCAFGLSVPMSMAIASGAAAKHKIIIKNTDALEILSTVKHVVFDKTGTLTLGIFRVEKIHTSMNETKFMQLISSLESYSKHPLAQAITQHTHPTLKVSDFVFVAGRGVSGSIQGDTYKVGNLKYIGLKDSTLESKAHILQQTGHSCIWCANTTKILGFVALKDELKTDAKQVIKTLQDLHKTVSILSGDAKQVVQLLADDLNVDSVKSETLPNEKYNYIKYLQKTGKVLMVGDGVNDAPALVQADSSIAIGSGSGISLANAHCVVLKSTLTPVVELLKLSQKTKKIIRQNIIFSLLYNVLLVPLAMAGMITPLFAAIAMPISSLLVIGNAARLRYKKHPHT